MMSTIPIEALTVRISPKSATPNITPVIGSRAPRMETGTEPIHWIDMATVSSETMVGTIEMPATQAQGSSPGAQAALL